MSKEKSKLLPPPFPKPQKMKIIHDSWGKDENVVPPHKTWEEMDKITNEMLKRNNEIKK